jgi:hypothetical protein
LAGPTVIQFVIVITSNLAIAAVSLILLFRRLRESQQLHAEQSP